MPKLSVIIPVYKVEKYIHKCIDSVLAQSFTDYELILVDDGSPDNCPQICDEYAKKDERIKVIHKQNGGLSDARNTGLDEVKGEYIYFLDGDDYIDSELFRKVIEKADSEHYDMVSFSYRKVGDENKIFKFKKAEFCLDSKEKRADFIIGNYLQYKSGFEAWNRIYRAEIIIKNRLRFYPNKEIYAEDVLFNLCYFVHAEKIAVMDDILHYYVIRDSSITGANKDTKINEYLKLCMEYEKYIKKYDKEYLCKEFPAIFYMLMNNRLYILSNTTRLLELSKCKNKKYFKKKALKVILNATAISKYCTKSRIGILKRSIRIFISYSMYGLCDVYAVLHRGRSK